MILQKSERVTGKLILDFKSLFYGLFFWGISKSKIKNEEF